MEEALEVSAKSVEEAVELALNELGLDRSEVTIEVLQEGRRSILGLGGEEAKVKVTPLSIINQVNINQEGQEISPDGAVDAAKEILDQLLRLMDVPATVEINSSEGDGTPATLDINDCRPGILIGRRGQTLSALQYLVNFMTSRKLRSSARVIIDVAGYRKRRIEELQNMAWRIADRVKSTNRAITLEPMLAWERRAIHITLRDDTETSTGSVGFGDRRKVVVSPRKRD
jgi:spoIIIJ-associated protein